jgi:hypothetical protein
MGKVYAMDMQGGGRLWIGWSKNVSTFTPAREFRKPLSSMKIV